jgi:[ribosomal protein S5]-alanine N-acetyltransferase
VGRIRGWPATLSEPNLLDAPVVLRTMRASDVHTRRQVRAANDSWLRPWDPSRPEAPEHSSPVASFVSVVRQSLAWSHLSTARKRWESRQGIAFTWVILYGGQFAGELAVWRIVWGSCRSAELGYWIDARFAGRGIMPTALAMGVDHCFQVMGMHRLEAGIQPENAASRRVVEKLGFRDEGIRVRQVHINGAWRDHICYAITAEEISTGMLCQWRSSLASSRA